MRGTGRERRLALIHLLHRTCLLKGFKLLEARPAAYNVWAYVN
jgi:hypothetical protein